MKHSLSHYIGAALLVTNLTVQAQKNEFSWYAGGGLQGLHYANTYGKASIKTGFQAGIGYTRFLFGNWGIRSGMELGYYQSRASLPPGSAFSSYAVDSEGEGFEYRVKANGYSEKQPLYTVNIPLLVQFQTPANGRQQLYVLGGVKLGIPFSQRYRTSAADIETSGYYPNLDVELKDLPVHGFGKQTGWDGEGGYDLRVSFSLSAEAGMRFRLPAGRFLYAGAYIDYGLNNLKRSEGTASLITYHPQTLAQSQATGLFSLAGATGHVKLLAYGIKLGFAMGGRPKKAGPAPVAAIPEPAPMKPVPAAASAPQQAIPKQSDTLAVVARPVPVAPPADTLTAAELALLKTPVAFEKKGDTLLSGAARKQVDTIIALLQAHPDLHLEVQGHTCDAGSDVVNERIGLARARAVIHYITGKDIDPSRVLPVSKADREPLAPNTSEPHRRKNRRVVFSLPVN